MTYIRRAIHDTEQAMRRTTEQNEAIVKLVRETDGGVGSVWGYTDVPKEGGAVEISHPSTNQRWQIERDGTVTVLDE